MMPQKKNPDPLEVIKGKAGFTLGQLMSLLSMGKGNFIGYNRDSQWTKYIIMDMVNECLPAPVVLSGVLETMTVNTKAMEHWCNQDFIGSTTIMEQMVQNEHIPMREAKVIVEKLVKEGSETANLDPKTVIALTKSYGGPGKNSMKTSLKKLKKLLMKHHTWLFKKQKQIEHAKELLCKYIQNISK